MPRGGRAVQAERARRHFAYLLRCADGTYYAGYTVDPLRRLVAHRLGQASRYTRGRGPLSLAAVWHCPTRRAALRLERMLKRLPHAAKQRLASGDPIGHVVAGAARLGIRRRMMC
ncbi:MAG TPA: GIY-YIG nuclease family protein [bacterium]|nr:GIY-YIG nuclease family protein [bacterium]